MARAGPPPAPPWPPPTPTWPPPRAACTCLSTWLRSGHASVSARQFGLASTPLSISRGPPGRCVAAAVSVCIWAMTGGAGSSYSLIGTALSAMAATSTGPGGWAASLLLQWSPTRAALVLLHTCTCSGLPSTCSGRPSTRPVTGGSATQRSGFTSRLALLELGRSSLYEACADRPTSFLTADRCYSTGMAGELRGGFFSSSSLPSSVTPPPPLFPASDISRCEARLQTSGVTCSEGGTRKAGGRGHYRGGTSVLSPSPVTAAGSHSPEVLAATRNYGWGRQDTLSPSPVVIMGDGSDEVLSATHSNHFSTSTIGIVTFRFGGLRSSLVAILALCTEPLLCSSGLDSMCLSHYWL